MCSDRPTILASVAGKILDVLIRNKLVQHLEEDSAVFDSHNSFSLTNLLELCHCIYENLDNNILSHAIYLAFRKPLTRYRMTVSLAN